MRRGIACGVPLSSLSYLSMFLMFCYSGSPVFRYFALYTMIQLSYKNIDKIERMTILS